MSRGDRVRVGLLAPGQWRALRRVRRRALDESPDALALYEREPQWSAQEWRSTFDAALWFTADAGRRRVGLARSVRESGRPWQRNIESVWVAPAFRGRGIARLLIDTVAEHETSNGVTELLAWVLDGNDQARRVYRRLGFESTNVRQPLPGSPGRIEERFVLRLADGTMS